MSEFDRLASQASKDYRRMSKLQVEELEPRRLLNGVSLLTQVSSARSSSAGAFTSRQGQQASMTDFGGTHSSGQSSAGVDNGTTGPSRNSNSNGFDPKSVQGTGLSDPPFQGQSGKGGQTGTWDGFNHGDANHDSQNGTEAHWTKDNGFSGSSQTAHGDQYETSGQVSLGTSSATPNNQGTQQLADFVSLLYSGDQIQNLAASWSSISVVRELQEGNYLGGQLGEYSQASLTKSLPAPAVSIPVLGTGSGEPEAPASRLSDLLTVLPPFDLSMVETGIERFLKHLEEAGRQLEADAEWSEICPWVIVGAATATAVAGAVAAVAYELARGDAKSGEDLQNLEIDRPFGGPSDPHLSV
jgi:hypothetical protein